MKSNFKIIISTTLTLFGIVGSISLNAQHQQISCSTMDDIRQVTQMATLARGETVREDK
jgi:hypothetical protein